MKVRLFPDAGVLDDLGVERLLLFHVLRPFGRLSAPRLHALLGERIHRELRILNEIAKKHGLAEYFQEAVRRTPRHKARALFGGTGFNGSGILLDGGAFRIRDIVDAAYVAQSVYQTYLELTPAAVVRTLARSVRYRWSTFGGTRPFPSVSEWS